MSDRPGLNWEESMKSRSWSQTISGSTSAASFRRQNPVEGETQGASPWTLDVPWRGLFLC